MADKLQKAKKAVKKAEVVKTVDELRAELTAKIAEQLESKKGHKLGELTNPHILTLARKEIARLHTAIRALEIAALKEIK